MCVIHCHSRIPEIYAVAVFAHVGSGDMTAVFAGGRDAVMTLVAAAGYAGVIKRGGRPGVSGMAVLAVVA